MFAWGGLDEIEGHVFDCGHVFGSVEGSQEHEVVVEDDIKNPVEAVFDTPVGADRLGEEDLINGEG